LIVLWPRPAVRTIVGSIVRLLARSIAMRRLRALISSPNCTATSWAWLVHPMYRSNDKS
jgi:hypothetical protein